MLIMLRSSPWRKHCCWKTKAGKTFFCRMLQITSATFDFEPQCLLQSRDCHVISNFIIWWHTKRITKQYSRSERCNQQRWLSLTSNVAPTPLLLCHVTCVPDQIRLSVGGDRTGLRERERERGWEEFLNTGEKDKTSKNRNFINVVDRVL
jgi:hypothetical protein